jgi:putative transposase
MEKGSTNEMRQAAEGLLFDSWIDAVEDGVRSRVRDFIETMLEEELSQALAGPRYGRRDASEQTGPQGIGVRNGHRERSRIHLAWAAMRPVC